MKIVPKDTKPKNYIWKKYTILDLILASILLAIVFAMLLTKNKVIMIIALILLVFNIIMFFPINNRLVYQELYQFLKFLFSKKRYKDKEIDKILPFIDILDDGYIKYDGYFGKVLEIGSKNFALLDDISQDIDISYFANALNIFDKGESFDIVKIDKALILDKYEKDLLALIDKEEDDKRKAILYSKLSDISLLNSKEETIYIPTYYIIIYANTIENLNILSNLFIENFSKTDINISALDKIETAIFLKYNFDRDFDEREAYTKSHEELISWIKPESIEFGLKNIKVNNKYQMIVSIEDYPVEVGAAFMANIFNMRNTKVCMHIRAVDQEMAIKRIDKALCEILSRSDDIVKASDSISQDIHIETLKELLVSMQADNERLFDVSFTVLGYNYNNENIPSFRKSILSNIRNDGFKVNTLYSRQIDGYINQNISKRGSLKIYERGVNSSTLAASFPFVSANLQDDNGFYLGFNRLAQPVLFNIWKRDNEHKNSNVMVIGTSGSGKSYFLKTLITNLYSEGVKIVILDPENEYRLLASNVDGLMLDVGRGDKGRINPFHIYPSISDSDDNFDLELSSKATFNTHLRVLESFFKIILPNINDEALELLNSIIVEVYSKSGIGESSDFNNLKAEDFPIFDDLYNYLLKEKDRLKDDLYKLHLLSSLITYISKFANNGRYSDIWNGYSNLKSSNDFTVFNFQSLFAAKNDVVANAQMLLVFRFLESELINTKNENDLKGIVSHTLIIVDEAHLFIDKKHPIALDFFYQMTKRIRKYGGAFIPATQSISDWNANLELRSKTSAILKNSQYSFIFNLKSEDIEDLVDIYKSSSPINEEERISIAKANRGECFFIGSDSMRISFYVDANDTIKEIFSKKIDIKSYLKEAEEEIKDGDNYDEENIEEIEGDI